MVVSVQYAFEFGKCDISDWSEWEIELTKEEELSYHKAVSNGISPNDVPELNGVISRAYNEIEEMNAKLCEELAEDNCLDDGCNLIVQFCENTDI